MKIDSSQEEMTHATFFLDIKWKWDAVFKAFTLNGTILGPFLLIDTWVCISQIRKNEHGIYTLRCNRMIVFFAEKWWIYYVNAYVIPQATTTTPKTKLTKECGLLELNTAFTLNISVTLPNWLQTLWLVWAWCSISLLYWGRDVGHVGVTGVWLWACPH